MSARKKATILYNDKSFKSYCIKVAHRFGKVHLPPSDIVFLYEQFKLTVSRVNINNIEDELFFDEQLH